MQIKYSQHTHSTNMQWDFCSYKFHTRRSNVIFLRYIYKNCGCFFLQIKNKDDFWVWAKSGMVDGIRAGVWYNDGQPLFLRGYINDKQSRIMGYATMRQLRVQKGI